MTKSSTILNREFRVKISGQGYHTLAGWPLMVSLIGEELAEDTLMRALNAQADKYTRRLRRGLKLDFYSK